MKEPGGQELNMLISLHKLKMYYSINFNHINAYAQHIFIISPKKVELRKLEFFVFALEGEQSFTFHPECFLT